MKGMLLRAALIAVGLTLGAPFVSLSRGEYRTPFETRVIDPETGEALPDIAIISDNGIVCHTQFDGIVRWTESSVMNRDTRFTVDGRFKVKLRPTPGGHADIPLTR